MRGLMNSCAPISGFVWPSARQARDLRLLGGEHVARLRAASAHRLAGGQQLAPGALGERLGPDLAEHLVGGAQLLARVDAPVLAAQPLAVHQVRAGEVHDDAACARAARSPRGRGIRRRRRRSAARATAPGCRAPSPCRRRCVRSSSRRSAAAATSCSPLRAPASTSSTSDQPKKPRSSCSHARRAAASGLVVPAEAVVEHRGRVVRQADRASLASRGRVLDAGRDELGRLGLVAAPGGEQQRRVHDGCAAGRPRDRVGLLDQRRRGGELAGVHVHAAR